MDHGTERCVGLFEECFQIIEDIPSFVPHGVMSNAVETFSPSYSKLVKTFHESEDSARPALRHGRVRPCEFRLPRIGQGSTQEGSRALNRDLKPLKKFILFVQIADRLLPQLFVRESLSPGYIHFGGRIEDAELKLAAAHRIDRPGAQVIERLGQ